MICSALFPGVLVAKPSRISSFDASALYVFYFKLLSLHCIATCPWLAADHPQVQASITEVRLRNRILGYEEVEAPTGWTTPFGVEGAGRPSLAGEFCD